LEDPGIGERILLKWIIKKYDWRAWSEFIRLRVETSGGLL
jgi:hypothetical protein